MYEKFNNSIFKLLARLESIMFMNLFIKKGIKMQRPDIQKSINLDEEEKVLPVGKPETK